MSAQSAVTKGRARAESLMLDAGKALRRTGRAYDPEEQGDVDTFADLFVSRCKVQAAGLSSREEQIGDRTATTVRLELHLPSSTPPLAVGDVWEFTAVDPSSMMTVGQRLRVVAPFYKTFATARRYEVSEVVS